MISLLTSFEYNFGIYFIFFEFIINSYLEKDGFVKT
jgi:hypothetical protein